MIIKEIETNAYKSLVDFDLEVNKKLNILIGSNNVGKSNILKLLDVFFNKRKITEQDFPKNLKYRLDFNNSNARKEPFIQLTFTDISQSIRQNIPNFIIENKYVVIKVVFDIEGKSKGYLIRNKNNSYSSLQDDILPLFIYLGDINQRDISLEYIKSIIPDENEARKNLITYSNQLLKNILDSSLMVSIEKNDDDFEINVIDEFGTMNDLINKSSGVQQVVFMALILSSSLDGIPKRRIFALEEPEMNLHAGVQKKLFNLIKSNSESVQTFITTHSPIFIDKADSNNVFHIGRNTDNVTIVLKNNYGDNWFSLKRDLGISINDNLFLGDINVIVEGATEKILLPHFITILKEEGIIKFDTDYINLLSAESAGNVKYFADVVTQQTNLNSILILDDDREGNNVINKIIGDISLKSRVEHFQIKRDEFEESEIEDIISDSILVKALSSVLGIPISEEELMDLRINEHTGRMQKFNRTLKRIEDKYKLTLSKVQLAHEIKKIVTSSNDIERFIETFLKIDAFVSNQQKR
ncbi:AAA family ATPase [Mesobacillus sp. AQ2]|uniref:ATP-dependent nuclease n=1 Tax=Mesobacillus sp. AQ2 TaxID=3043332 RepID=UPI0024C19714|nr:AAA family ATPase [Mesobacillus sp. AQ2]WHX41190.1 AAA family ATPase [Mesobacillus sp. AQ2]